MRRHADDPVLAVRCVSVASVDFTKRNEVRFPARGAKLSLVWAVLDRASRGWRGVDMNPANVRLLQQLRADLFRVHETPPEEVSDLPETVIAVA